MGMFALRSQVDPEIASDQATPAAKMKSLFSCIERENPALTLCG
jgi:hypothetical protein